MNEDIVTALKNSIERGDSLESAMQILINSGYNLREVQEASKFLGEGAINLQNIKPDEHLIMPNQRSMITRQAITNRNFLESQNQQQNQQISQKVPPIQKNNMQKQYVKPLEEVKIATPQTSENIKSEINEEINIDHFKPVKNGLAQELKKISPPKKSYLKEIILLIILLGLIGLLIVTIIFKDNILKLFS